MQNKCLLVTVLIMTSLPVNAEPYLGVGVKRTGHILSFPLRHPIETFHKGTYPVRHPLMAFERFGHWAERYQPGMNFLSAASGPVTSAGVFAIPHR